MKANDSQPVQEQASAAETAREPEAAEQTAVSPAEDAAGDAVRKEAETAAQTTQTEETAENPGEEAESSAARELEELRKQAEENYERFLRAQADFENFRRRTRLEKEELVKYASSKLIEQLLPVLDNFDRALATSRETEDLGALLKGLEMIQRQLDQVLADEGLKRMETVGRPFDPEYHQAVMQVQSDEHEDGVIVEELQPGYMLKDRVIRPAMVKVNVL